MPNGNSGWMHAVEAIIITMVGAGVGVAIRMQSEDHNCQMGISLLESRVGVVEKRVGAGGWSDSDMHWYNAELKATSGHEVPDLKDLD